MWHHLKRKSRAKILISFAVAALLAASACGGSTGSKATGDSQASGASTGGKATGAGTVVVAMSQGSLRTLDPNNAYEPEWFVIGHELYQTLVSFNGSDVSKVVPAVAQSWSVAPDGKTYTFKLNSAAKFADGKPITATDVVFSLKRFKNTKGPGAWLLDNMADAVATDLVTVTITLNAQDVSFLSILTSPSLAIGEAAIIKQHGGTDAADADKTDTAQPWLNANSAGSGPFILKSWVRNTELVMERNPNYWGPGPLPQAAHVVIKFVADSNSQLQLVKRGDAAIAMDLTPDQIAALGSGSGVAVGRTAALGVMYLGWTAASSQDPALAKPDNWDAIRDALDYQGIVALANGAGQQAAGIVPSALAGGLTAADAPKQDLAAARAALAKAGNPSGFKFTLTYASESTAAGVPFDPIAQKIQADLAKVGIQATLHPELQVQFYADYRAGKLPAVLHWWLADYADAENFLPVFVPPGAVAVKRQHWPANDTNAKVSDLAAKSLATVDDTQRADLLKQAQLLLDKTGPYAPLIDLQRQIGYSTQRVAGLVTNPVWVVDLAATTLK